MTPLHVQKVGFIYSSHSLFCFASRSGLTKFEFPPLNVFVFPASSLGAALVFQINTFVFYMCFCMAWYFHSSPSSLLEGMITFRTACFKRNPAATVLKSSILVHDFSTTGVSSSTNYVYTNHFPFALKDVICARSRAAGTAAVHCEGEAFRELTSSNAVLKAQLLTFIASTPCW